MKREIQKGLYLEELQKQIGGAIYTFRELHSADGYCFYEVEQEQELADNEEQETPTKTYMKYIRLGIGSAQWTDEQINEKYISVPIETGFEIV